jgi:hypothetical protein
MYSNGVLECDLSQPGWFTLANMYCVTYIYNIVYIYIYKCCVYMCLSNATIYILNLYIYIIYICVLHNCRSFPLSHSHCRIAMLANNSSFCLGQLQFSIGIWSTKRRLSWTSDLLTCETTKVNLFSLVLTRQHGIQSLVFEALQFTHKLHVWNIYQHFWGFCWSLFHGAYGQSGARPPL